MRKVAREEIVSNDGYRMERDARRRSAMAAKARRRVHVGSHLTFLFENADTVRYQIQEMLLAENNESEAEVEHELRTYNELLGDDGELGCTLLIEIDDPLQRDITLRKWLHLPRHVYLKLAGGETVRATFDERQLGEERLSSVQYLKFRCGDGEPVAIGLDAPDLEIEVPLTGEQREALAEDLRIDP